MAHHFDGRGFRIHYVEEGEGQPVVFVHGYVMDHTMYAAQFEDLPDSYRCIALDLRGHGHSECPPGPWSMADSVSDVIAFIESVVETPVHLVGMSWGGMIAMRIALQRGDLLRSTVLIDTSADAEPSDNVAAYRGYMDAIAAGGITDDLIEISIAILYGERYRNEHPDGIAVHADRLGSMRPEAAIEGLRAIVERDSVVGRLGEIALPTLVIHGEQDAAQPVAGAEEMAGKIPGAEFVRVVGVGHTTPLEAPDEVNAALSGFLARVG